jgi:hypothetical protein
VKAICASRGQPPATLRRDAMTFTLSPKEAIFAARHRFCRASFVVE